MAVKCPEPEMCGGLVPKEVLERWGDALFEAMILKWKRLKCPFKDWWAPMMDEGDEEAVECPSCWRMFCAQCKVGWHGEMECGEFEKLRKEAGGSVDRDDVMRMKLADKKQMEEMP